MIVWKNFGENLPERLDRLIATGVLPPVVVAFPDCFTRLGGNHCYDVYAGVERLTAVFAAEPGTYVLTDFLATSFQRTVIVELGLDRHPELLDDYFRHYTRVVWLAGRRTPSVEQAARAAADRLGLPLEIIDVGLEGLQAELASLLSS